MRRTVRRPLVVAVAAALALVTPLLLSGCSLIPHGDGGITLPGGVSVGSGTLPKDFPKEVPVVDGDIAAAGAAGDAAKGRVWNVTVKVAGQDVAQKIDGQLTGAGFTNQGGGTADQGSAAIYTKDHYSVAVIVSKDNDAWVANYTVTYDPGTAG